MACISLFYLIIWSVYRLHCLFMKIFRIYIITLTTLQLDCTKKLPAGLWTQDIGQELLAS